MRQRERSKPRGSPELEREATLLLSNLGRIPRGGTAGDRRSISTIRSKKSHTLALDPTIPVRERKRRNSSNARANWLTRLPHLERQWEEEQERLYRLTGNPPAPGGGALAERELNPRARAACPPWEPCARPRHLPRRGMPDPEVASSSARLAGMKCSWAATPPRMTISLATLPSQTICGCMPEE